MYPASAKVVTPTPTSSRIIRSQTRVKSKQREYSQLTVVALWLSGNVCNFQGSVWDGSVCSRGADGSVPLRSPSAAPRSARSSLPSARPSAPLQNRFLKSELERAVKCYQLQSSVIVSEFKHFAFSMYFSSLVRQKREIWKVKERLIQQHRNETFYF